VPAAEASAAATEVMRETWKRIQQAGHATTMTFEAFAEQWQKHAMQHQQRMAAHRQAGRERSGITRS
jgi:hypothetical protein